MSRHHIDLGSSSHVHHIHDLQLEISSSIQVSELINSNSLLGEQVSFDHLLKRNVWVSWSSNSTLRLNISLEMHTSLVGRFAISDALQQIAELLTRLSLWPSLNLLAAAKDKGISVKEDGASLLSISLQAQPNIGHLTSYGPGKFPKSVGTLLSTNPFIRPPPEIPIIQIHEVNILISFASTANPLARKVDPYHSYKSPNGGPVHGVYPRAALTRPPSNIIMDACQGLTLPALSDPDEEWESLDDSSPFSSQESVATCSSIDSLGSLPSAYEKGSSSSCTTNPNHPFISLLNTGFRILIGVSLPQHGPATKTPSNKHRLSLAELSPSIFSPGYSTAMHQRSCFIPLIAKGVNSMLKSSNSEIRELVLSDINEAYRRNYTATKHEGPTPTSLDTNDILRCFLWIQMQQSLCNADEVRRTRQLTATSPLEAPSMQLETPSCSLNKMSKSDSINTLVETNDQPDPDWCLFDDEEDILLSDEVYCDQQEEWYNQPPFQATSTNDGSELQEALVYVERIPDSDDILPSSPCLLTEIDMETIPTLSVRDDPDMGLGLLLEVDMETETPMEILQSSSPLILPMIGDENCNIDNGIDGGISPSNTPNLDSRDVDMML
ncbi:hypothetical protein FQN49_002503 [Arthroderma sp. PD_2]|nr:hypothetical protein FQN49_002503 [Arthroderma sp. PD_2]